MNNMKNLFVTYKLSTNLKEKGFKEPCIAYYFFDEKSNKEHFFLQGNSKFENFNNKIYKHSFKKIRISAPLWQQVTTWLEEVHNLYLVPHHRMNGDIKNYWYSISKYEKGPTGVRAGVIGMITIGCHTSDHSALQSGIEKALELI